MFSSSLPPASSPPTGPFGKDDGQEEYQRAVSENVNKRLTKAMGEIQERHDRGTNEVDDLDRAPTGTAYREVHRLNAERSRAALASAEEEKGRKRREAGDVRRLRDEVRRKNFAGGEGGGDDDETGGSDDDDDDEYDYLLDDDPELETIRNRRIREMRAAQAKKAEDVAKGHGTLRTVSQDEFLPECASSSEWVAVHFYSDDFERCKIMDKHLGIAAPLHTECKFLRIDANKVRD